MGTWASAFRRQLHLNSYGMKAAWQLSKLRRGSFFGLWSMLRLSFLAVFCGGSVWLGLLVDGADLGPPLLLSALASLLWLLGLLGSLRYLSPRAQAREAAWLHPLGRARPGFVQRVGAWALPLGLEMALCSLPAFYLLWTRGPQPESLHPWLLLCAGLWALAPLYFALLTAAAESLLPAAPRLLFLILMLLPLGLEWALAGHQSSLHPMVMAYQQLAHRHGIYLPGVHF